MRYGTPNGNCEADLQEMRGQLPPLVLASQGKRELKTTHGCTLKFEVFHLTTGHSRVEPISKMVSNRCESESERTDNRGEIFPSPKLVSLPSPAKAPV